MKIAILKEAGAETRVAAIPETVKKFAALGASVTVEQGAGASASIGDGEYEAAGASIGDRAAVLAWARRPPSAASLARCGPAAASPCSWPAWAAARAAPGRSTRSIG